MQVGGKPVTHPIYASYAGQPQLDLFYCGSDFSNL